VEDKMEDQEDSTAAPTNTESSTVEEEKKEMTDA